MQLHRHFVEKPWGRTDIPAAFGAPAGARIGEIWYEHANGPALPLLVKWLFTSEKLSIQVHPSDADARSAGLPSGKEECWYIVDAAPGAVIGLGTIRPLDSAELRAASVSGEIEALMDWRPVAAGDFFYIPAGTIHAIGAGITLVEVQQNADITYRLYDYRRLDKGVPRVLHLDKAVTAARAEPYRDERSGHAVSNAQLVDGPRFSLWFLHDGDDLPIHDTDRQQWIVPLSGPEMGTCFLRKSGEDMKVSVPHLLVA